MFSPKILRRFAMLFLSLGLFFSGCGKDKSDTSARFTIKTPPFPEIQEMVSKISASLSFAGETCLLTIDADWTLGGQCPGLPTGTHSFTLNYQHTDLGVIIASATGAATLASGNDTNTVEIKTLKKDQDDDGDGHSNLVEAMFQTGPKNSASKPGMPPFFPRTSFPTGSGPSAVVLGDLNGDSFLDVVTANGGDDTVSVLLGNGNGAFNAAQSFATGVATVGPRVPTEIVLTQLNTDDNLDLVVINSGEGGNHPGDLAVLLGNGDGTFQTAVSYATGSQPSALVLGDLNADGRQDALTGNFASQTLSVLLGNADGTFQTTLSPAPALGDITALALGRIDAGTTLDLVASTQSDQSLKVLIGNGDGTFQAPSSLPLDITISLALRDLNGDASLDLVAALASDQIAVLMGSGNGTFQAPRFFNAGKTPGSLTFADLDKDGNLDLVTENEGEGILAILLGKGDGTFQSPAFFETGPQPSWTALGDLNADGRLDVVTTDRRSGEIAILLTK